MGLRAANMTSSTRMHIVRHDDDASGTHDEGQVGTDRKEGANVGE